MDRSEFIKRTGDLLQKYKYAIGILLLGLLLISFPTEKEQRISAKDNDPSEPGSDYFSLETKLENILSMIDGAGKVRVLLTEVYGEEILFQTDENTVIDTGSQNVRKETVLTSASDRSQTGLVRQVNPPVYLGAVVICQGAKSAAVRLAVSEAVSDATGLSYDRITVLKMK